MSPGIDRTDAIDFARVGEIDMAFNIRGAGPRLVLISGTGGDLRRAPTSFDRLLDRHFEVLRFDQRGMGQSAKPDVPYTMAGYAEDAAGLMRALGFAPDVVLGYSFGGMVAQELAIAHPQMVPRLALLCTSAGGAAGASFPLHTLAGLPDEARAHRMIELADTRRDAAWQAANPALFAALLQDQRTSFALIAQDPDGRAGASRQLAARALHDTSDRLHTLAMPVAVFGGLHDGVATPQAVRNLAACIPHAHLELFDGGHLVQVQNPAAARAVVTWLTR